MVNKTKFWKDYKFWLPLFISVSALASTIIISLNLYSPFELEISESLYMLPNSLIIEQRYTPEKLNLVVPITFLNKGKKAGVIQDIYLEVTYAGGNYPYNHPITEVDSESLLKDCGKPIVRGKFKTFLLGGEQQLQKDFIFGLGNIEEGLYVINLYVKAEGKLNKMETLRITVDQKMKLDYLKGSMLFDIDDRGYSVKECVK